MEALTGQLVALKDLTGGNPIVAIILVAILMASTKPAWTYWSNRQKYKASVLEKELELKAKIKLAQIKADDDNEEGKKRNQKDENNKKKIKSNY
jgi:type II secretory pathway pseudopilin PulG